MDARVKTVHRTGRACMKYDFDTLIDRHGTKSLKYDFAKERGRDDGHFTTVGGGYGFSDRSGGIESALRRQRCTEFTATVKRKRITLRRFAELVLKNILTGIRRRNGSSKRPALSLRSQRRSGHITKPGEGVLIQQPVYYPFT